MNKNCNRPYKKAAAWLCCLPVALALTACTERPIYSHESLYEATVQLSIAQGSGTYKVALWGEQSPFATAGFELGAGAGKLLALPEGDYRVEAVPEVDNVTFADGLFCVAPGTDGLLPVIAPFSAGTGSFRATAQRQADYEQRLYPYTRQLDIVFRLPASQAFRIAALHFTLSGIATSRALYGHTLPHVAGGTIGMTLTAADGVTATPASGGEPMTNFTATHHLLGMQLAERQLLHLRVDYSDGGVESIDCDLSRQLSGFNFTADPATQLPFRLDATLLILDDAEVQISVKPWDEGINTDGDADMEIK